MMVFLNISVLSLEFSIALFLALMLGNYQVQSEGIHKNDSNQDLHKKQISEKGIHGNLSLANKSSAQDQI